MKMQRLKGFCVVLWSLIPLLFLFGLNLYMVPHYRCNELKKPFCKPGYRAILQTNSALPYGALLTGNEAQLQINLVQDFTETNVFHSSSAIKGKYLVRPTKKDEPLAADSLGSLNDVISGLPLGTTIIHISRGNAIGLTGQSTIRLVPKLGTEESKVKSKEKLLKEHCPILANDHKVIAVLDIPASKDFVYLAIQDMPGDWNKCYKVLEAKDLIPLVTIR